MEKKKRLTHFFMYGVYFLAPKLMKKLSPRLLTLLYYLALAPPPSVPRFACDEVWCLRSFFCFLSAIVGSSSIMPVAVGKKKRSDVFSDFVSAASRWMDGWHAQHLRCTRYLE